jgi:hypothetical protein
MLTNRWLTFSAITITHIAAPLLLLAWLVLVPSAGWIHGFLRFSIVLFATIWLSLAGYWTTFGYYLRYLWPSLAICAGFMMMLAWQSQPAWSTVAPMNWLGIGIQIMIFVVLIHQLFAVIQSYFYPTSPVMLALPLRYGTYGISFGGNGRVSSIMNYHYKYSSQTGSGSQPAMAYAVDIVKLQGWGMSQGWVLPANNEGFAIYQAEVLSPIVRTGDIQLLLGHLQRNSITCT